MELQQLRHFLAVQREGGFRKAAESLNISQPALSQSIGNLEDSLGVALFERGPHGTQITQFGQTLTKYASTVLREVGKAREEMGVLRGLERGRVNVGVLSAYSSHIAPQVIASFLAEYPKIEVAVSVHLWPELSKMLDAGELDFVFSLRDPSLNLVDFEYEVLEECRSGVYARADHPLAGRKNVTLHNMAAFDWVMTTQTLGSERLFRRFESEGLPNPRIAVRTDSFSLIRAIVREKPLLCMIPENTTAEDLASGRLVRIDQDDIGWDQVTALIYTKRVSQTPAAAALMEAFRHYAEQNKHPLQ